MPWKLFIVGVLLGSLAFQTFITNADQPDALPVAFMQQFDGSAYAGTDCGPASVAMAINYATGEHLKPLDVRLAITKLPGGQYASNPGSGTAIGDLARIARAHDVEVVMGDGPSSTGWGPERIRKHLAEGHPVIVLVKLAFLPGYSATSTFDHYVLLTGASGKGYTYNDPGMSAGAKRTISEQQLQTAQRNSSVPGQGAAFGGPKSAAPAAPPALTFNVTVAKGDTLSELAAKYSVPLKEIVALNRTVVNVDRIQAGQVLQLPGKPPATPTVVASPTSVASPTGAATRTSVATATSVPTVLPAKKAVPTPSPVPAVKSQQRQPD
jgi:LysM repeat protein